MAAFHRAIYLILSVDVFRSTVCVSPCGSVADLIIFSCPVQIPLGITALDGFAFVVFALSLCQGQQDFGFAAFKIKLEGNQGVALFIHLAVEPLDFMSV